MAHLLWKRKIVLSFFSLALVFHEPLQPDCVCFCLFFFFFLFFACVRRGEPAASYADTHMYNICNKELNISLRGKR